MSVMANPDGRRFRTLSTWGISIAVALAVVGFVGAMQWNSSLARDQFTTSAQQVLAGQVTDLEAEQDDLRGQLATANAQVQRLQQQSTGSSVALAELNRQLAAARLQTGLTRGARAGRDRRDRRFEARRPARREPVELHRAGRRPARHRHRAVGIGRRGDHASTASGWWPPPRSTAWAHRSWSTPPSCRRRSGSRRSAADGLLERFQSHPAFLGRVAQRIDFFGLEFASQVSTDLTLPAFVGITRFRWAVPSEEAP